MKWFSDILKEFKQDQRMAVLILLLVITSTTFVLSKYFHHNACTHLVDENIELHNDLVYISSLVRDLRQREIENMMTTETLMMVSKSVKSSSLDSIKSFSSDTVIFSSPIPPQDRNKLLDELVSITSGYVGKSYKYDKR